MANPVDASVTIFLTPQIALALAGLLVVAITMLNNYLNEFFIRTSKNLINCLNDKLMAVFKLKKPPLTNGNLDSLDEFRIALKECGLDNQIIPCRNNTCHFGKFRKSRHGIIELLHSLIRYIGFPFSAVLLLLSITTQSFPKDMHYFVNTVSIATITIVGSIGFLSLLIATSTNRKNS
jgi:hypothetical protein